MRSASTIIILFVLFYCTACLDTTKPLKIKDSQKVVEMSKGPCFGSCPVYTLTVYETGIVTFKGVRFTDRQGLFTKKIDKSKVQQITNKCIASNLWQFDDVYKSNIADMATVSITYFEGKEQKTISGKRERPMPVLEIEQILEELAFTDNWEQIEKLDEGLPPGAIENELIVKLNRGVEALAWSKGYNQEGLELKKELSNDKTYWLVSFNTDSIDPKEMIDILRRDQNVFSVQFNQNFQ